MSKAINKNYALPLAMGVMLTQIPIQDVTSYFRAQAWMESHTSFYTSLELPSSIAKIDLASALEITSWLRDEGLPIAVIAEICNVERKTIYAWLHGGPVKEQNLERLTQIFNLLSETKQADLRSLYRLWNRQIENKSLKMLFSEMNLDEFNIKSILKTLWPIAKKNMEWDKAHSKEGDVKNNPFLSDIPDISL